MGRMNEAARLEREIRDRTLRIGRMLERVDPMLAGLLLSMADEADCHLRWLEAVERAGGPPEAAAPEIRPADCGRPRPTCPRARPARC